MKIHLCANGCRDDRQHEIPRYKIDKDGVYHNLVCFNCGKVMGVLTV